MTEVLRNDLEFCWTEVLRSEPWFRLSFSFAPAAISHRILALYALFAMLERPLAAADETVLAAQLAWWRDEFTPQRSAVSSHPVVRALRASGALACVSSENLDRLLSATYRLAQPHTLQSNDELRALCNNLGAARANLELAVAAGNANFDSVSSNSAGTALLRLVDMAGSDLTHLVKLVPLELQAKHQYPATKLEECSRARQEIFSALGNLGSDWLEKQLDALSKLMQELGLRREARHLVAAIQVSKIRFESTIQGLLEDNATEPGRWSLLDAVEVWRGCRRISLGRK